MSEDKDLFEAYLKKDVTIADRLKQPRFWAISATILTAIILSVFFYRTVIKETMSTEEVGRSIQIAWQDSKWVDKYSSPYSTVIVPSIKIKVKNVGERPLQYVHFEGVFEFVESGETLSDGFAPAALKEPLLPGETSDAIDITSYFGYSASSKEAFIKNISEWKRVKVRIFARTKHSQFALLGVYDIKQEIEGIQVVYKPAEEAPVDKEKK